jgi:hypothetical protein
MVISATTLQGGQSSEDEQKTPQVEMPKGGRNFEKF